MESCLRLSGVEKYKSAKVHSRDGKEAKLILGSCSIRELHQWYRKDASVVIISYGLTVIVSTS